MRKTPGRPETFHLVAAALGGVVLLFVVAPLLGLALSSSLDELRGAALDEEVRRSIGFTLWSAMAATLLMSVPAIPLAYLLARRRLPFARVISAVLDLPVVIPHAAAGLALLTVMSRGAPLGAMAERLGIELVSAPAGVIAAMAFVSLPFLVHGAREGFLGVPVRLETVALNLGASPARVFFTVSLPLARRSILSGMVLMWARGMSEFGAIIFIAYRPMVAPVLIWERFGAYGLAYARPVALLFVGVCLVLFVLLRFLEGGSEDAGR